MTQPVLKRADQLVIGDLIPPTSLPAAMFREPGKVVFTATYSYRGERFVFVAYWQETGYDSTTYLASRDVQVIPADDPEVTQPIAGRVPAHYGVVELAGGPIEIDPPEGFVPASAP